MHFLVFYEDTCQNALSIHQDHQDKSSYQTSRASGVTFRSFSSPVQISTHGTFLGHVFTAESVILRFTADIYISSIAKFSTSLLTYLFIYSRLLREMCEPKNED
jgi:hypothetical protein